MNLIEKTIARIQPQSQADRRAATARLERLTMPHWALGRILDLGVELAGMTRSLRPSVAQKTLVIMAADHGVAAAGVSKYPQEVTQQMVLNFVQGGAGANALAKLAGAHLVVVDMGVAGDLSELVETGKILSNSIGSGTANMMEGPAMTREQAEASVMAGIEVAALLAPSTDLFGTGEMGIGNTTPSSAITAVLTGETVASVTGRGTGIEEEQLASKIAVIEKALEINQPDATDALDVLAKVGGFEIGGLAGLILGAAALRKPVLVDGFISTAAALLAQAMCPAAADYMISSHRSVEQGQRAALRLLKKEPLLDLGLRLGEGTGAALAMNLVEGAVRVLTEVATFDEAGVSEKAE